MPFKVEMSETEFRIVGPAGEIGVEVPMDSEVASLVIGNDVYICRLDDVDAETVNVECVTQTRLMPTVLDDDVIFPDDDDDDGEDTAEVDDDDDDDTDPDDDGDEIKIVEKQVA